jgi:hypothetical protein
MSPFSIRSRLTLDDWNALRAAHGQRTYERVSMRSRVLRLLPYFFGAMLVTWGLDRVGIRLDTAAFLAGVVLAVALILISSRATVRRSIPDPDGVFLSELTHEFSASGIHSQRPGIDSHIAWSCVKEITVTPQHLFLWTDRYQAVLVPVRDLPEGMTVQSAHAQFDAWRQKPPQDSDAQSNTAAAQGGATTLPATSHGTSTWWRAFSQLLLLRSPKQVPASISSAWLIGLSIVLVVLWVGIDWWSKQPDVEFYLYNVPMLAWFALALLAVSSIAGALSVPRVDLRRSLAVSLAGSIGLLLLINVAGFYLSEWWMELVESAAAIYVFVYLLRALRALSGVPQPRAALLGLIVTLILAWATQALYVDAGVWVQPDEENAEESIWRDGEQILFEQPARIDAALAKVQPSAGGAPNDFFIGFAGVGEQRVFAEEIALASRVIGEKFGTTNRSLRLINDRRDYESAPLATVSGLRYALSGIAERMNLDRDVLFLSLSSHGSDDPLLAVSNSGLPLSNLSPEELASELDDAGIRWRVIVISACYAGGFIDALRNDQSIVIAAAAADRVSFGCADDRDLTYFGEAFYRDALPKSHSLREAFENAKQAIAEREREEGFAASKPQAFFGKAIEQKLATLPTESVSK